MEYLAAAGAGLAVLCLFTFLVRAQSLRPSESRLHRLSASRNVTIDQSGDGSILRRNPSSIPAIGRLLTNRGYAMQWSADLERAGLTLRPIEYILIRVLTASVAFLIVMLIFLSPLGLILACVAGAAGFMVPAFWVGMKIKGRVKGIEDQLVETLTLMSNSQRAGFAFAQAVELAAQRTGPPISIELNRMLLDLNLGASTEDALVAMNDRIGSEDLDLVVTAILIHRQTGGNLAEILDNVTETMRDRERIRGEIKTLTASQRLAGIILSGWPVVLGLIFTAINPSMMSLMWTTTAGIIMLVIMLTLNLAGYLSIRRILAIDI
ncbi:MAG: type II secretion system F family protein [Dehalococcoidia bacterium]